MKILIAEDNADITLLLETVLTANGYTVECASDGREALKKARNSPPDLIISDLMMPGMDGYMFCRKAKEDDRLKAIPFILYTATVSEKDEEKLALSLGAARFLSKPIEMPALLAAVREELEKSRSAAPASPAEAPAGPAETDREYLNILSRKLHVKERELEETRRSLESSEEKYRKIFENVQDVFYRTDMEGNITEVSPSIRRYCGYLREELLGRPMASFYADPADRTKLLEALEKRGEVNDYEVIMKTRDGRQAYGSLSAHIILDKEGGPAGVEGVLRDIGERKRMEEEIKLKEIFLDNATDFVFVRDFDGNFFYVNETACKAYGYSANEFLNMNVAQLYGPESAAAAEPQFTELLEKGNTVFETAHIKKDGARMPVEVHARVIEVYEEYAILSAARDITERKLAEEKLRESSERMRRMEKLDSIGQLSGGIAHDLNNLLGPILGYAALMRKSVPAGDPRLEDVEEIIKAAERAAALVRQLLAFSRKQVLKPRVVNLNIIVSEICGMLGRVIGERIRLDCALEPALGDIMADPGQIERVIMNLAVNARDAMPRGGAIMIKTAGVDSPGGELPPGRYAALTVKDTGLGMEPAVKEKIFEPFFTTKQPGHGIGLGLSTVYGIVKQSGGDIQVESRPGEGAVFTIYLPLVKEGAPSGRKEPVAAPARPGKGVVLLVEDDEPMRRVTKRMLSGAGYEVAEAADGKAALQVLAGGAPVALIITDLIMPEMDGIELSKEVLRKYPGAKILFISGYADREENLADVLGPETAYLSKPFSPDALLNKIGELLGRA